jgi:hypothetical protein
MQKLITISLFTVYLLGNTEVGQLVSLPKLFVHYHQHQATNKHIGFIDFLSMHYYGDDGTIADDNEDNELPFKQLHHPLSDITFEVPLFASFNSNHSFLLLNKLQLFKTVSPKTGHLFQPLQPPDLFS